MIFDICGKDSPQVVGLGVPDTGTVSIPINRHINLQDIETGFLPQLRINKVVVLNANKRDGSLASQHKRAQIKAENARADAETAKAEYYREMTRKLRGEGPSGGETGGEGTRDDDDADSFFD